MLTEGHDTNTSHLLADYSEQARAQALERFQLLQPHLEDGVVLSTLARQHDVPLRTMQYWLQRYRQHGLAGLCRRRPSRPSHPHPARRTAPQLVELIEGLALRTPLPQPPLSIARYSRSPSSTTGLLPATAPSMELFAPSILAYARSPMRAPRSTRRRSTCCIGGKPHVPTRCGRRIIASLIYGCLIPQVKPTGHG